jgi:two-component system, chemotaxis family, protein-glutamate methylesterase/glutaminase
VDDWPRKFDVVVVGASAGAVEALSEILPRLPSSFPLPIVVVVHVPGERRSGLRDLFGSRCNLRVFEAEDKAALAPGTITFAAPGYHLLIECDKTLALSVDEPVNFSRPSIDVLFESAAEAFGERTLGVLLTGANSDGARGLERIVEAGGVAVVQDPKSAASPAMPTAALALCRPRFVLDLPEIGALLASLDGASAVSK